MSKCTVQSRIFVKRKKPAVLSLLQRVASGDVIATHACIERFQGLIWSLTRRSCANATEAEDMVQEIFIDIWRSAARFDPKIASETTFISVIARRRLIDRTRRRMRRPAPGPIMQDIAVAFNDQSRNDSGEAGTLALAALEQLRPEQQQVLQLSIQYGCSHEQIASSTGLPLGTVKTHARRGLMKLRNSLIESGIDLGPL